MKLSPLPNRVVPLVLPRHYSPWAINPKTGGQRPGSGLDEAGYTDTLSYVRAMSIKVLEHTTGLLPHLPPNPGRDDLGADATPASSGAQHGHDVGNNEPTVVGLPQAKSISPAPTRTLLFGCE